MAPKLSIVIVTLNEESRLSDTLRAAKAVADQILIYDTGSTDGTVQLAESFGATVRTGPWRGFADTKNNANQLANYDWILSLDADEVLSPQLTQSILQLKAQSQLHNPNYSFNRLCNYCGRWIKHCGWYPDVKWRLFDRRFTTWQGTVHEKLISTQPTHNISHLPGDLLHYSFDTIQQHASKAARYAQLHAQSRFAAGKSPSYFKLLFSPIFTFIKIYFFRLGFLDGSSGFTIARIQAFERFLKQASLIALHRSAKGGNNGSDKE